ncbi:MAG TPA: hypothetical protein VIV11_26525, partial [Kofleriaceae bacterium]
MGDPRDALPRYRTARQAIVADVGRAIAMAAGGALAFAPVEYALTLWAYSGSIELVSKLRLAALTLTLALWLWLMLAIGIAGVMVVGRLVRGVFDPDRGRDFGWFVPAPPVKGVRPGVPKLWATLATLGAVGALVQRGAVWADYRYTEPELTAIMISIVALVAFGVGFPLRRLFGLAADVGAHALAPTLRVWNPLGRWRAAGIACAAMIAGMLAAMWFVLPQSRSVLPVRLAITAVV